MFKLDAWEGLESDEKLDKATLAVAKELAFEMCLEIFERLGLSVTTDDVSLRVAGRGATFVFPLRGDNVPLKYAGREGTSRLGMRRTPSRGRSPINTEGT